jgi:hypothetical protein
MLSTFSNNFASFLFTFIPFPYLIFINIRCFLLCFMYPIVYIPSFVPYVIFFIFNFSLLYIYFNGFRFLFIYFFGVISFVVLFKFSFSLLFIPLLFLCRFHSVIFLSFCPLYLLSFCVCVLFISQVTFSEIL